jgi:hypothetical protein
MRVIKILAAYAFVIGYYYFVKSFVFVMMPFFYGTRHDALS